MSENELEIIKMAKRQYLKDWRTRNKDKIKAINDRYFLKKAKRLGIIAVCGGSDMVTVDNSNVGGCSI